MGNVLLSTAVVPTDFCFTSWQESWPSLVALLSGQFNRSGTGINFGNQVPAMIDQDKPWFRTNSDGTPDRFYSFSGGLWLAKHALPPGAVIMYEGTEASIETFDGGEGGPIGPTFGAFWEKVSEMNARSPIGPGTLPSGAIINVGDDTGNEEHTNIAAELVEHNHDIIADADGDFGGGDGGWLLGTGPQATGTIARELDPSNALYRTTRTENEGQTTPDPFSLVHPVHGIWFIRRSARLYFRI